MKDKLNPYDYLIRIVTLFFVVFFCGCSELPRKSPVAVKAIGTTFAYLPPATNISAVNEPPYFRDVFKGLTNNESAQEAARATVAYDLMRMIDEEYAKFEQNLRSDRDYKSVIVQFTSIGLSSAGALTGTSDVKSILAAIDTGIKGADATVDKTVFREKASEALINQMRASRSKAANVILLGLKKDMKDYPLEALISDLQVYYNCGNVTSALADLANQTTTEADNAANTLKTTRGLQ